MGIARWAQQTPPHAAARALSLDGATLCALERAEDAIASMRARADATISDKCEEIITALVVRVRTAAGGEPHDRS